MLLGGPTSGLTEGVERGVGLLRCGAALPPLRQVPAEAASVLHCPATLGKRFAQRSRDLRPARFCGKLARSTSSPMASSIAATATDALWGSTPIKTFMSARTSVSERTSAIGMREGHSDFGPCSHTSFESLRVPGAGGTRAENKPTHLTGDRKLVSDPCVTGALEA